MYNWNLIKRRKRWKNRTKKVMMAENFENNGKNINLYKFSSVAHHVWLFASLGLQHTRLLCPSPTSGACSNYCPSSWWCHPTISSSVIPFPPDFNLCQHQGLLKWVSTSHQVAKYWSFSFSISPSNESSGLIFFRIDWLHLLAAQGILKNLLQQQSLKA